MKFQFYKTIAIKSFDENYGTGGGKDAFLGFKNLGYDWLSLARLAGSSKQDRIQFPNTGVECYLCKNNEVLVLAKHVYCRYCQKQDKNSSPYRTKDGHQATKRKWLPINNNDTVGSSALKFL